MKFHVFIAILLGFTLGFGLSAMAAPLEPLKFKAWKEQQIVEAQNEVLRISARLHAQKSSPKSLSASPDTEVLGSSRFQQTAEFTDRDMKMAQESLEIAKEFSLQDYADVYVSNLQNEPEQFTKLITSLSKDEMTQLMKILVKNKNSDPDKDPKAPHNDAKHNKGSPPSTLAPSATRS
jgi:hypothetical protein